MKRTIVIDVENRPGELARIVNLFAARGINIETLNVSGATAAPALSCVTVQTDTDDRTAGQLLKLLEKQVRVVSAREVTIAT